MSLTTAAIEAKSLLSPAAQKRIDKQLDKGESTVHHSNLKNFKSIMVGNHKFYIISTIWRDKRFEVFKKWAEAMIKRNPDLPQLWN